jgi:hypothetical protein
MPAQSELERGLTKVLSPAQSINRTGRVSSRSRAGRRHGAFAAACRCLPWLRPATLSSPSMLGPWIGGFRLRRIIDRPFHASAQTLVTVTPPGPASSSSRTRPDGVRRPIPARAARAGRAARERRPRRRPPPVPGCTGARRTSAVNGDSEPVRPAAVRTGADCAGSDPRVAASRVRGESATGPQIAIGGHWLSTPKAQVNVEWRR